MPINEEEPPLAIGFGMSLLIKYFDPLNANFACHSPFFCITNSGTSMSEIDILTKSISYEAFAGLFSFQSVWYAFPLKMTAGGSTEPSAQIVMRTVVFSHEPPTC